MAPLTTIGIAEDKKDLRKNLEHMLDLMGNYRVLFSVDDGSKVLSAMEKSGTPDVLLMDIEMPVMDGIEATSLVKKQFPAVRILMLTVFDQKERIFNSLKAGADGYLLKGEKPQNLVEAIHQVLEGRMPMSPEIAQKTLTYFREMSTVQKESTKDYALTPREVEILELLCSGLAYKNIADACAISERTVNKHVDNIYRKLNVHNAIEASNIANKNDWF